jgi:hypothetical protein
LPEDEMRVEVFDIAEAASRHEVALGVLHPGLDLALCLSPVWQE